MSRTLILGGGFGGVATAVALRELVDPSHSITLVDRRERFAFGFRKTWEFLGIAPTADGSRLLSDLERRQIEVIRGTIDAIDPSAPSAVIDGERHEADSLVVALGAGPNPGATPGFAENGSSFYDPAEVERARRRLLDFAGGRVAIAILGLPYPCPPAPYETALLMHEFFRARSIEADIYVYSPQPMSLPVLGDAGCSVIEGRLADLGIAFHPDHVVESVEPGQLRFKTGPAPYDLLIGIPAHASSPIVVDGGLAESGGWIRVDPLTLATDFQSVYAVGDGVQIMMANGKPLPKAGVFAEAQGKVVAQRIAAELRGEAPEAKFDGLGSCFLEVGGGEAMLVQGNFLAEPAPQVELAEASPVHYQAKLDFEASRLAAWFGDE